MSSTYSNPRFTLTLCLASVRTKDAQSFRVHDSNEGGEARVTVGKDVVVVDEVVARALPSRIASAVLSAVEASGPHTHSAHVLVGAPLFHGSLAGSDEASMGDAVVESLIQAQHTSHRAGAKVFFDECLIFGKESCRGSFSADSSRRAQEPSTSDSAAICCESVKSTDSWELIRQDTLSHLSCISLVLFKYPQNRSAAVLLGPRLTTAHIAALTLAARRGIYLCVDGHTTAREVGACVGEMRAMRESLETLTVTVDQHHGTTVPSGALLRYHAVPGTPGAAEASVHHVLDALARSDEEYSALTTAVERDLQSRLAQAQNDRSRLEQQLAEEKMARLAEVNQLRRERLRSQSRGGSPARSSFAAPGPVLVGHRVDTGPGTGEGATAKELREALQEARRGQRFAEEKLRLLEFKYGLEEDRDRSQTGRAVSITRPASQASRQSSTAPSAVASESLALAQEFQQRERQLQLQLREATAELTTAQATRREMENTLLLQSRTIAEAKRALAVRSQWQAPRAPATPPRSSGGMISPTRGPAGPLSSPPR